jgi:hypothetical protein
MAQFDTAFPYEMYKYKGAIRSDEGLSDITVNFCHGWQGK